MAFEFDGVEPAIREDLREAFRYAWDAIATAGSWWSGEQRVAIADESRRALDCASCRQRKDALSPETPQGDHESGGVLPAVAVDAVHRITTDPGRLSPRFYAKVVGEGALTDGQYVELLGVLVGVISIDSFHFGMGLPLEPLPQPRPGAPSGYRPTAAVAGEAWVPMLPPSAAEGAESDLWRPGRTANVIRAMSLVPDAVRLLKRLSRAMYLPPKLVATPGARGTLVLERIQTELVAGRVSALNECFY